MMSPKQAAELLGLSVRTVLRMLRDGRIFGVKIGRRWFINVHRLRAQLEGKQNG